MAIFTFLDGYKTYIAAAGLFGLALYRASLYDFPGATESFMLALTALGLRSAVAKVIAPTV